MIPTGIQASNRLRYCPEASIRFQDRTHAGRLLGAQLSQQGLQDDNTTVLGLVRGGALVACEAAKVCQLPWDVFVVRKIGAPDQPEYAVGAVCETGRYITNQSALHLLNLDAQWVSAAVDSATSRCLQLSRQLRAQAPKPRLAGRRIVLVDDGMATGLTMRAAISGVQGAGAGKVIVAVPVLAPDALAMLRELQVEVCYLSAPPGFRAVGQYYAGFQPVTTEQVVALLAARARPEGGE